MVAVAIGNIGIGVVGIGTSKRVGSWVLREVLQEDRRLELFHFYLSELERSLVGHHRGQGVGPFQEGVYLAKQASRPLGQGEQWWERATGAGVRAGAAPGLSPGNKPVMLEEN